MKRSQRLVMTLIIALMVFVLSSCSGEKARVLTKDEIDFLNSIADFKDTEWDIMDHYMSTFIEYYGVNIPEDEMEFLLSHTDDKYKETLRQNFINTARVTSDKEKMDKWLNSVYDDNGMLMDEDEARKLVGTVEGEIQLDTADIPEKSSMDITRFYYMHSSRTFASKVYDYTSGEKMIYFEIENNKVANIYEMPEIEQ